MLNLSDEELAARCKRELPHDTRSYEVLVQRHMNRVYGLIYRMVGNREEAEDLSQEVFVKVYNNIKKYEQQAAFATWLYRIATNTALDALDRSKRRPQAAAPLKNQNKGEDETDLLSLQPSGAAGPEESAIQVELRECISRVLRKLDKEQARMLVMRDFNDLSYDEIASSLGAGLSAVKMRIHRSRLAFQEIFGQLCGKIYLTFSPQNVVAEVKAKKQQKKA